MKIINPNDHPVIKQIRACKTISSHRRSMACQEITKMVISNEYRMKQSFKNDEMKSHVDNIHLFMGITSINRLFSWEDNILGWDFWSDLCDDLYIRRKS